MDLGGATSERTTTDLGGATSERTPIGPETDPDGIAAAIAYCLRPAHLRRTAMVALVVGTILTLVNQSDTVFAGAMSLAFAAKVGANYVIPFIVSNLGLLSGRPTPAPAVAPDPLSQFHGDGREPPGGTQASGRSR